VATQQTFLQVSQSGYTNVIDGHASLQSWPLDLSPLLNILPPTIITTPCITTESSIAGGQENKPLDRKRNEMKENLLFVQ